MAEPTWKRLGFKSYYEYRDFLARAQGYSGYSEQRKARKLFSDAGNATLLRGSDISRLTGVKPEPGSILPPAGKIAERAETQRSALQAPSNFAFPRTSLFNLDNEVQEIRNGFFPRKNFGADFRKIGNFVSRSKSRAVSQVEKFFPKQLDLSDQNSFVARSYRQGLQDAAEKGASIETLFSRVTESDIAELDSLNSSVRSGLLQGVNGLERNSRTWDRKAQKVISEKDPVKQATQAKRLSKQQIIAYTNPESNYSQTLKSLEDRRLTYANTSAYHLGVIRSLEARGLLYYEVSDGPDCGWESHGSPIKANGMVVNADQARAYPQAHPYCRRQFLPIADPEKGKERWKESEARIGQLKNELRKQGFYEKGKLTPITKAALATGAASAAMVGLTTAVKVGVGFDNIIFEGTAGDIALNYLGQQLNRALVKVTDLKNRALEQIQKRFLSMGFDQKLDALAAKIAQESGLDTAEVREAIILRVHQEAELFDEAAEGSGQVVSLLTRRALGVKESAPVRVVGDTMDMWERWRHLTIVNEVIENSPYANDIADLIGGQGIISNVIYSNTRFNNRFFRFSLPRINTIKGNTGERGTSRYARLALAPNKLAHVHFSILPKKGEAGAEGLIRLISNVKFNPNGLARLGFVKGEDGILRPNLSLVPKGPLRVYSRVNRASKYKSIIADEWAEIPTGVFDDVGEQIIERLEWRKIGKTQQRVLNIDAGRVNSVTTEIRLITKWSPISDMMWYKFRVNLKEFGIKKISDLKNISIYDFRVWVAENPDRFTWLSAGVKLRLKGGNLFDFSRSIRIDPTTQYRIRNVEKNLDALTSIFTDGIRSRPPELVKRMEDFKTFFRRSYDGGDLLSTKTWTSFDRAMLQQEYFDAVEAGDSQRVKFIEKILSANPLPAEAARPRKYTDIELLVLLADELGPDETLDIMSLIDRRNISLFGLGGGTETRGLAEVPSIAEIMNRKGVLVDYVRDQGLNAWESYLRLKYFWNEFDLPQERQALIDIIDATLEKDPKIQELSRLSTHSPWQLAQTQWIMVKKDVESRLEQLTDYLVTMKRSGIQPDRLGDVEDIDEIIDIQEIMSNPKSLIDAIISGRVNPEDLGRLQDDLYWYQKPDIIIAAIEADPKMIARDLASKVPSFEDVRDSMIIQLQLIWRQYYEAVPESVQTRVLDRIRNNRLFSELAETAETIREVQVGTPRLYLKPSSAVTSSGLVRDDFLENISGSQLVKSGKGQKVSYEPRSSSSILGFRFGPILDARDEDEIVEVIIDGPSRQKIRGKSIKLVGDYEVTGNFIYSSEDLGFPEDLPTKSDGSTFSRVRKIYIRQLGQSTESPEDLVNALASEEVITGSTRQAQRYSTLSRAFPWEIDALTDLIKNPIAYLSERAKDSAAVVRIKQMIDSSDPLNFKLYRELSPEKADSLLDKVDQKEVFLKETLGIWRSTSSEAISEVATDTPRVIVVLTNARAINLSPMQEEFSGAVDFLSSGRYKFVQRLDDVRDNTIYLYFNYSGRIVD